jgi:hypothetical protein
MDIYPDKADRLLFETRSALNFIRVWEKLNGFRYLTLDGVQHGGHIPGQPGRLILPYFKGAAAALIATAGVGVPGVVRKPKARMAVAVAGFDTSV